ncbi:MAG: sel1 repeat family protein [Proteobacteria bacterium]|nr:sel1 repeat family protein [Pseudomonadota bacterium]
MRLARIYCAALAFLSAAVIADDFEQLRDAVAKGDYSAAVPALQAAAAKDDPRALGLLASLYQHGQAFPHDPAKALELYTRAADLGDAEAQFALGSMYLLGDGVKADEAWALTYYRKAAAQGHEGAKRNLAELYRASGITPAPPSDPPPDSPVAEEAARLRAEPAVAPVPALKTEALAAGMSTSANPPVAGAVARDITRRPPAVPLAAPAPATAGRAISPPVQAPVAPEQNAAALSLDELRALDMARKAGIEVRMEGSAAPPPTVVTLSHPAPGRADEAGQEGYTPSSAADDVDTVENTEEGAAAYSSAQRYLLGQGVAVDAAVGVQWLERAARAGHTQAKYELALHYLKGEGVQADDAMAITLLRDAAQAGHDKAAAKLKAVYSAAGMPMPDLVRPAAGDGPTSEARQSSSASLPLKEDAPAAKASTESRHHETFERQERHPTRGAHTGMMADAAAEEEDAAASNAPSAAPGPAATLGEARAALDAQDLPRAATLFTQLAEAGNAEAQAHIGYMTYRGEGVRADKAKAVEWYRKAAAQGNRDAQYNLAVAYAFGDGVAQNDAQALHWYQRAAEQGSAVAQYSLGVSYALGEGARRDDALALKWVSRRRRAAGYADAQFNLGQMIRSGRGVKANENEGLALVKQAADNGSAAAQYSLGNMYRAGSGVKRDLAEATRLVQARRRPGPQRSARQPGHAASPALTPAQIALRSGLAGGVGRAFGRSRNSSSSRRRNSGTWPRISFSMVDSSLSSLGKARFNSSSDWLTPAPKRVVSSCTRVMSLARRLSVVMSRTVSG